MAFAMFRRSAVSLQRARVWLLGCRTVSTPPRLESVFNNPERRSELKLRHRNVGLFQIPQLKDHTGFCLLQQNAQLEAEELVEEATSSLRTRKLVEVFDELSDCLCCVADMADFVRIAHPDRHYANAAGDTCVSISGLVEKMNTNTGIHRALNEVLQHGDIVQTDAIDDRVAELFMFDFEQSGIHLPEKTREEFVRLNESIMMLGTHFMQGTQKQVLVKKEALPEHFKNVFGVDGDNFTVNGMYSDHINPMVREAAYKIYLHPDKHQTELLEMLLSSRDQLAKLVGFSSYAHRALGGTMGATPENVNDFLETLSEKLRPQSDKDFELLRQMKVRHGGSTEDIRPWDISYFSGLSRHETCEIHNMELAPFFSLGTCMAGLSDLIEQLFGVKLQYEEAEQGELWSDDVQKLAVIHETEGVLGHIYCDLFERSGKPATDCHFTIRGGRQKADGSYQKPAVVLMLSFPPPRGHFPSLLTPSMLENLFHEFGHAMHSMLGRTRYQHVTGTRCPTDFAEVPSILMEYFINDPRVIATFARHWQTGEKLSEDKIMRLCAAKRMFGASEMQLQVFYSLLDQTFHSAHPLSDTTIGMLETTQNKHYNLPYVPGTAWHLRFGHFVGYGAKYYSYLMSRAVAASIWHRYFKREPFNREDGERYRQEMLAHGGGVHPAQLVHNMLGEEPTADTLVQSLMHDLEE